MNDKNDNNSGGDQSNSDEGQHQVNTNTVNNATGNNNNINSNSNTNNTNGNVVSGHQFNNRMDHQQQPQNGLNGHPTGMNRMNGTKPSAHLSLRNTKSEQIPSSHWEQALNNLPQRP